MNKTSSALAGFHPLINQWFIERVGIPTDVQAKAWPSIATEDHVLITAPTGSGKTLTAFLWAINQLITGQWDTGRTSVLYISPLKALNNDIHRNLNTPITELREVFKQAQVPFPDIHVFTRSGDTSQADRRRMLRTPPEILITTPESLNLMLSSKGGQSILTDLTTVILDEIHSVLDSKRGVHLITAVDRLVRLSGEFQRIALSATIRPMNLVADFIGGYVVGGNINQPVYLPREVSIIQSADSKQYKVKIRFPGDGRTSGKHGSVWDAMLPEFKNIISSNRSTLMFVNSRRLSEKITYKLNQCEDKPLAYSHHGSLSREIREDVEKKLKAGALKTIVATSSLEMGIDVGSIDEVILIQSPPSVSSAIQRIGRAGHQVGELSRGTLFPTHSQDFLEAAVLGAGILNQDIEAVKPVNEPLDILAQIIISMVGIETWDMDELFMWIKTSYPYHNLSRKQFDLVLNMTAGRYADSQIRELKPRISIDRIDNNVAIKKGALLALYMSGGSIPDRGYFHLKHDGSGAKLGDLDEEFVWEAFVGKVFTVGTQNWKITRITHNDVFVVEANPNIMETPFWKSEEMNRDFHFSERISCFLENVNDQLETPQLLETLENNNCMDTGAANRLVTYLKNQRASTGSNLPHRHHLLIEYIASGPDSAPGNQLVLHTFWGGQVNRPFTMALEAAWEQKYHNHLEIFPGNDCIVLILPQHVPGEEILSLVTSSNFETLLKTKLEGSGFFGARFRECAGRALLITRNHFNQRMPLWMNRLRSQKLMNSVMQYNDFPILLETWRTCLQDEFDLENLLLVLQEIESGVISWSETRTSKPSPFAQGMSWDQINKFMYLEDQPLKDRSNLSRDLLADIVFSPDLRPSVPIDIIERFESKRQRLHTGYSPQTSRDLVDWVKERLLIPLSEWNRLLQAIQRDISDDSDNIIALAKEKLIIVSLSGLKEPLIAALESISRIKSGFYTKSEDFRMKSLANDALNITLSTDPLAYKKESAEALILSLLVQWLQYYGPKTREFIALTLGIPKDWIDPALDALVDVKSLVEGHLILDTNVNEICDSENLETILRINRADAIPTFQPLDLKKLPQFLSHHQGISKPSDTEDGLFRRIEQLLCLHQPAEIWESEILPARMKHYSPNYLDMIIQEGDLRWLGTEKKKIAFCFESELELMALNEEGGNTEYNSERTSDLLNLFSDTNARYDFTALLNKQKCSPTVLSEKLWDTVWEGKISNDTFSVLRKGILNKFHIANINQHQTRFQRKGRQSKNRGSFSKWKKSVSFTGNWFRLISAPQTEELIEIEEHKKERVRILLDRYGILFRELLLKESTKFQWASLFRTLRLMELSGEVLAGYFFKDIPGPQFISHPAFRNLQSKMSEGGVYWINATDPASICGLKLNIPRLSLPKRVVGSHLVFCGNQLVLVSERHGKTLTFYTELDDDRIQEYICVLRHLLTREFNPIKKITVEKINGEFAAISPYSDIFSISFDVLIEHKHIVLYRKL